MPQFEELHSMTSNHSRVITGVKRWIRGPAVKTATLLQWRRFGFKSWLGGRADNIPKRLKHLSTFLFEPSSTQNTLFASSNLRFMLLVPIVCYKCVIVHFFYIPINQSIFYEVSRNTWVVVQTDKKCKNIAYTLRAEFLFKKRHHLAGFLVKK